MHLPIIELDRALQQDELLFDGEVRLPAESEGSPDGDTVVAARLAGRATRGERGLDLDARVRARVRTLCSRCAESMEISMNFVFRLILVPDATEFGVGERELEEEEALFYYAEEGRIDLSEVALEQLALNQPLKPVCSSHCLGLCPTCGANRKRIKCACRQEVVDPRLAPLADLKKRMSGET